MNKVFSVPVSNLQIEEVNNGDFLKVKMYIISEGINRNNTNFLFESFEPSMKTIYNKPILAYYNKRLNDTEEHNSKLSIDEKGKEFYDYDFASAEKPVGVIPESAKVYIEKVNDKNWIVIDSAFIWTEYNKRLTDLIKRQINKKVSVEVEFLESYDDENGIECAKLWKFLGVTILGRDQIGNEYREGIEGAHLIMKDYESSDEFNSYKKKFNFALSENNIYESEILNKYKINSLSKKKYKIDKSKESVSNTDWSKVDKTKLRNTILNAENVNEIVKSVYLKVESGWQENPSEKLKYPVMQLKRNTLVYNSNGLLSAYQYAQKYDKEVADKAEKIRVELGLSENKKEEKMKQFAEILNEMGLCFVGKYSDKYMFASVLSEDIYNSEEEKPVKMFALSSEDMKKFADGECEDKEAFKESVCKFEEDDEKDETEEEELEKDGEEEKEEVEDEEKKEMKEKICNLEEENKMYKERCENAESELASIKKEKFEKETNIILEAEKECLGEECCNEVIKMRDEGKFADVSQFEKEVAYRKYLNEKKANKENKTKNVLDFSLNKDKKDSSRERKNTLMDRLSNI